MKEPTNIRRAILRMMHYSHSSHIGSCFSIVEILYVLYFRILAINVQNPLDPNRDRFILSKGHASAALYATLAERGLLAREKLERYFIDAGELPGHLDCHAVDYVEAVAGSLGHGLSIGVGMALANQRDNNPGRVYVLLGDGECNEGSVWEAIMLASTQNLNNLTAIVDFNGIQSFGRTNEVIDQRNLLARWQAFGWDAIEVDGHDVDVLEKALSLQSDCPRVVIARTVKGKGISFMEDKLEWHYRSPSDGELAEGLKELLSCKSTAFEGIIIN